MLVHMIQPPTFQVCIKFQFSRLHNTVEPQWFEHLWNHGNSFETWVIRATEG